MPSGGRFRGIDPKLPINTCFCKCAACGEYFNSEAGFDMHRLAGKCRTKAQMKARGMSVSAKGYWITQKHDPSRHQPGRTDDLPEEE